MFKLIREAEIAWLKALKGMSPTSQARPVSPWKSRPPSANSSSGARPARLADHGGHPVAAELVPVAVEEDVVELLDRARREELRIGAPVDGLGPPRPELEQRGQPALRVRDDEVVLGRIGAVVVVEARVHAAVLGQAHRHVAVVEDHRDAEALAQERRDAAEVRHRDGEHDDRVDVLLALEHLRQMPLPAWRHPAPDRLAGRLVEDGLVRRLLGPAEIAVALQPRQPAPDGGEALTLDPGRVRRRPPPRRLDRTTAVRRHDQIGADLVEALPELPPRGRAAVTEVEVDRRRDREDLRRFHARQHRERA